MIKQEPDFTDNKFTHDLLVLKDRFYQARAQFPMLSKTINDKSFIYLDSAATTHKPEIVIDTMSDFYRNHYGTVHRAVYTTAQIASDAYEKARSQVASFFNIQDARELIFTRGTTDSLNILASSLAKTHLKAGKSVVITAMEHHSNIVPWQMACDESGARLIVAPIFDNGDLDLTALKNIFETNDVAITSLAHISNVLGAQNPIEAISDLAHSFGSLVSIDGAQSAPHVPVDLQALNCDFYTCSAHKMVGPTGIGILWGRLHLLESLSPTRGGGDMIDKVTFDKTTYNVPPLKFEPGTPMIVEAIGFGKAVEYLSSLDMNAIYQWEHHLTQLLLEGLTSISGVQILGRSTSRGSLVTFNVEGIHPLDIATMLDLKGIAIRSGHLCGQPILARFGYTTAARASLAFYNTEEEVFTFLNSLSTILQRLR